MFKQLILIPLSTKPIIVFIVGAGADLSFPRGPSSAVRPSEEGVLSSSGWTFGWEVGEALSSFLASAEDVSWAAAVRGTFGFEGVLAAGVVRLGCENWILKSL